jgi:hypothetical protein
MAPQPTSRVGVGRPFWGRTACRADTKHFCPAEVLPAPPMEMVATSPKDDPGASRAAGPGTHDTGSAAAPRRTRRADPSAGGYSRAAGARRTDRRVFEPASTLSATTMCAIAISRTSLGNAMRSATVGERQRRLVSPSRQRGAAASASPLTVAADPAVCLETMLATLFAAKGRGIASAALPSASGVPARPL